MPRQEQGGAPAAAPGEAQRFYAWNGDALRPAEQVLYDQAGHGRTIRNPPPPPRPIVRNPEDWGKVSFHETTVEDLFKPRVFTLTRADIQKFSKHHPEWFDGKYRFRDPNVHVGLEVEVENVLKIDAQLPLCFWSIHEDGSLRNRGREFKTHPMPLQYTEAALKQLFASINDDVDFSKRTSIHGHIDVRQLTLSQTMGVIYTYGVMENLLFKFAGANRRNSIFCVPITETELFMNNHETPVKALQHMYKMWQKYTALNIKPLSTFGTLEFRQLPGTTNIQQILIWLDMLSHLRVYAYRYSLDQIVRQISDLNTSSAYRHFVEDVFGDLVAFLDTSNLLHDMEKACYLIKNSGIANPFHQKVISTINEASSFYEVIKPKTKQNNEFSEEEIQAINYICGHYLVGHPTDTLESKWVKIRRYWKEIAAVAPKEVMSQLLSRKKDLTEVYF